MTMCLSISLMVLFLASSWKPSHLGRGAMTGCTCIEMWNSRHDVIRIYTYLPPPPPNCQLSLFASFLFDCFQQQHRVQVKPQEISLPSMVDIGTIPVSAQRLKGLGGGFAFGGPSQHQNLAIVSNQQTRALPSDGVLGFVESPLLSQVVPAPFHLPRYEQVPPGNVATAWGPWGATPAACVIEGCAPQHIPCPSNLSFQREKVAGTQFRGEMNGHTNDYY